MRIKYSLEDWWRLFTRWFLPFFCPLFILSPFPFFLSFFFPFHLFLTFKAISHCLALCFQSVTWDILFYQLTTIPLLLGPGVWLWLARLSKPIIGLNLSLLLYHCGQTPGYPNYIWWHFLSFSMTINEIGGWLEILQTTNTIWLDIFSRGLSFLKNSLTLHTKSNGCPLLTVSRCQFTTIMKGWPFACTIGGLLALKWCWFSGMFFLPGIG